MMIQKNRSFERFFYRLIF